MNTPRCAATTPSWASRTALRSSSSTGRTPSMGSERSNFSAATFTGRSNRGNLTIVRTASCNNLQKGGSCMTRLSLLLPLLSTVAFAQTPDAAFFEAKIRPVLANKCYGCHSSKLKAPMGGLVLDTKAGMKKATRLLTAIRYTDPHLQMPPTGKLPDNVIADFEAWVAAGSPDPRVDSGQPTTALKGMPIEEGRKWWAFQPVHEMPPPAVK